MEIAERKTADIVTLSLSGRLDTTTAKTFEKKILAVGSKCASIIDRIQD